MPHRDISSRSWFGALRRLDKRHCRRLQQPGPIACLGVV